MRWFLALLIALTATGADAKVFKNSYIRFNMPSQWDCKLEGKAWLCRHKVSASCQKDPSNKACEPEIKKSREALIVLTAKPKTQVDSLKNYQEHFGEVKTLKRPNGVTTQSRVNYSKIVNIKKLPWVDALHLSSELPHYFTRYLATIKGNVAVLVTYTSHKTYYTKYSTGFFRSIKSLTLIATDLDLVNQKELGQGVLSHPIDIPEELFNSIEPLPGENQDNGLSPILFGLAMLLAAAGVYLWIKNKKSA